jgi:hypothetical protein
VSVATGVAVVPIPAAGGAAAAAGVGSSVTRRATSRGVQSPSAMCSAAVKGSRVPCSLRRH